MGRSRSSTHFTFYDFSLLRDITKYEIVSPSAPHELIERKLLLPARSPLTPPDDVPGALGWGFWMEIELNSDLTQHQLDAIEATFTAIAVAPRKPRLSDVDRLADLLALHKRYTAHVRQVVADLDDDEAAKQLHSFADSLDDADHDWLTGGAVCVAERLAEERAQPDWDVIREQRQESRMYLRGVEA